MNIIQTMKQEILQPEKRPQFSLLIQLPERLGTGTLLSQGLCLSGTVYLLLQEKPHILTPLWLDCAVLSLLLILPETKSFSLVRCPPHTCYYNRLSRMWRSDCSTRQKQRQLSEELFQCCI